MLEIQQYTKPQLTEIFGSKTNEGLKRKLTNYDISYTTSGRGKNIVFDITAINDPFKVYCITDLGFPSQVDFYKLRYFLYYYLNDVEFMSMPDEVKESRMDEFGKHISRQTIANYIKRFEKLNFVHTSTNSYIYYFAYKDKQRITDRNEYCRAWREYWQYKSDNDLSTIDAISLMRTHYGGVARKQAVTELNGIYSREIDYISSLIQQSIESELEANTPDLIINTNFTERSKSSNAIL